MREDKKIITYATTKVIKEEAVALCTKLTAELPIILKPLNSIQEIFPLLSQPSFYTDYIVIDVDDLYHIDGADAFDIIKALSTLINCTVCRDEKATNKPTKRNTQIVALVSETTSVEMLNELLSMPEINYLSLRVGPNVTYNMIKSSIENFINQGQRAPKFILDLIKHTRHEDKKDKGKIQLTGRQQQILDIVATRGASNKHIAKMLSISDSTVKLHMGAILKKYGVKNRTQLAVFAKKKNNITEAHM